MANQHQKPKKKSSIDARKPNNDKYPKDVFFDEWFWISLIL
jgi:hypothetical protein